MARVLVVDDEVHIFKLVEFRLRNLGHQTLWAYDGGQALEMISNQRPDLLLLDVMMPVMDGFQVLKLLKSSKDTQDIPVVMLTSREAEKAIVSAFEAGADDYVVKPFSFPELLAR